MTIDEFIEAAKNRPVTNKDIEAFRLRIEEQREEAEEWDRASRHFDLNRTYTI